MPTDFINWLFNICFIIVYLVLSFNVIALVGNVRIHSNCLPKHRRDFEALLAFDEMAKFINEYYKYANLE